LIDRTADIDPASLAGGGAVLEYGSMPARVDPDPSRPPFDTQLRRVIEVMRPGGKRATDEAIAAACGVSARYIGQLRSGERSNPSGDLVTAIAAFFGVDPAFFLNAHRAEEIGRQLDLLDALARMDVRRLALSGPGLSESDLAAIERLAALASTLRADG
jgi:transcriptional regulator with XRE-family HTH domain